MSMDRYREVLSGALTPEHIEKRLSEGWEAVAVEWQRPTAADETGEELVSEVPYGLMVAQDCYHLKTHPGEHKAMVTMLEMICDDQPLSQVATKLNDLGSATRSGKPWTQSAVFDLLPRLVEVAPEIFATENWSERRKRRFLQAI